MLDTKSAKKNEKGIALIFSLIMLSLLMILALSFTMDSMFEQKAAYNSASTSSSGFMGQAQLKQVLLLMKEGEANFDSTGMLYSRDSGSTSDTDMLKDKLPVSGVLLEDDGCFNPAVVVNWNYVKDVDGKIIGRTAFVVVPEDKIPLDSLLSSTYDETLDAEYRIGKDVSEINVNATISSATTTIINVFNWEEDKPVIGEGFTGGGYTGSWSSYDAILTSIKAVTTLTAAQEGEIENNLSLTTVKDEEAFWMDLNTDIEIDNNETYKRFDLTRDWDTADNTADVAFIKDKILLTTTGTSPDVDMEPWDDTDSTASSKGLPWLACFGYKTDGTEDTTLKATFTSVKDRRLQIAANLKDYCDTDSRPTSDIDPVTWSTTGTTAPTYTGNEKTPYINKIGIRVAAEQDQSGTDPYDIWANIVISPCVELINIYDTAFGDTLTVNIEGTITIRTQANGAASSVSKTQPFTSNINIYSWEWTNPGYSNLTISNSVPPFSTDLQTVSGGNRKVNFEVTQIKFTKVVLTKGADGYDYTKDLLKDYPTPLLTELNSGTGYSLHWYGFAVHDPRQNLNNTDWLSLTPVQSGNPATVFSIAAGNGASNAENSVNGGGDNTEAPTTGPDPETTTDPATGISTAHIRNDPMESPWELGFIHRGAKWETINLKTYDITKAFQKTTNQINSKNYIPGGGAYASGDANILDQIKMTASAKSPQKINISSQDTKIHNALFSKIKLKPTIDSTITVSSMAGGSDTQMLAGVSTIITNVKTKFSDDATYPENTKLTRASIVDKLLLPLGTTITATTDADQEELIGKIVNLTKISENGSGDFSIIVLSQTINDVGTSTGIRIYKYSNDGTSGNKLCNLGTFDADTSDSDSDKHIYYDEITGEQKIMLKGNSAIDGTITIKSFQYID